MSKTTSLGGKVTHPVAGLLVAVLLTACSGGDSGNGNGSGGAAGTGTGGTGTGGTGTGGTGTGGGDDCTITLSGELTGTLSCTVAVIYDGQADLTAFGLTVQQSEPGAGADVRVSGPAETGTFTDATCVECNIFAFASAATLDPAWAMKLTPTKQGSFSVTIDSLGTGSSGPNGAVAYPYPHGSATAVLPADPETSATGTVNLSANF